MGLHDDLTSDSVPLHMDTFGTAVVYYFPDGGSVELLNVIVGHEANERRYFETGYEYLKTRTFELDVDANSETFCGLEKIIVNGSIEYDGQRYGVERLNDVTVNKTVVAYCAMRNPGKRNREGLRGSR